MRFFIGLSLVFFASAAHSQSTSHAGGFELIIRSGDKISSYVVKPNDDAAVMTFQNSDGRHKNVSLSKRNFNFLVSKVDALPETNSTLDLCPSDNLRLTYYNTLKSIKTCNRAITTTAKNLRDLATLLTALQ